MSCSSSQTSQQHYILLSNNLVLKATMMNQKLDFMHKGHIDIYKTNESKLMDRADITGHEAGDNCGFQYYMGTGIISTGLLC
jgi:hypothetical protein